MAALVFGTALRQDWGTLGTQMIYVGLYSALLAGYRNGDCGGHVLGVRFPVSQRSAAWSEPSS